jgi:hypothetical protein
MRDLTLGWLLSSSYGFAVDVLHIGLKQRGISSLSFVAELYIRTWLYKAGTYFYAYLRTPVD